MSEKKRMAGKQAVEWLIGYSGIGKLETAFAVSKRSLRRSVEGSARVCAENLLSQFKLLSGIQWETLVNTYSSVPFS